MESMEIFLGEDYQLMNYEDSLELNGYRHAAHCIIYSASCYPILDAYTCKAYIMMMMRHDGHLGFPGGFIDKKDENDNARGLNRELLEEINLDKKYLITKNDHCLSVINKGRKHCYHGYVKEVSPDNFQEIEKNALSARDYGKEVLGLIRVPLFTLKNGVGGFPTFLSNSFVGCAKYQLLYFLLNRKLVTYDDIKESVSKSLTVTSKTGF